MRWLGTVAFALMLGVSAPASAEILVVINKSTQSLSVSINGSPTYNWTVSTGSPGRDTPNGSFTAQRLERVYYSKKYDDAPMPNSVFFYEGYAIHGTYQENRLGSPVSHGCVRLSRSNAITLYNLVSAQGIRNTRVVVVGQTPQGGAPMARYDRGRQYEGTFAARSRTVDYGVDPRSARVMQPYGAYASPREAERRVYWSDDRPQGSRERRIIQVQEPYGYGEPRRAYRDNGWRD